MFDVLEEDLVLLDAIERHSKQLFEVFHRSICDGATRGRGHSIRCRRRRGCGDSIRARERCGDAQELALGWCLCGFLLGVQEGLPTTFALSESVENVHRQLEVLNVDSVYFERWCLYNNDENDEKRRERQR